MGVSKKFLCFKKILLSLVESKHMLCISVKGLYSDQKDNFYTCKINKNFSYTFLFKM